MPNPFDILQQRMKSAQPPPSVDSSSIEHEAQVSLALNARMCITAPPGYVLASVDYRNQE